MHIFEELESEVRGYIRSFPTVFDRAEGALLFNEEGRRWIDFFAGAGVLNYGHNHPAITRALIAYLQRQGIVHGLDMATSAKAELLEKLRDTILSPRKLDYKIQFPGPTGTNAVESALKLARMVKQRSNVIAFSNGYHGMTMGSLAVTGNAFYHDKFFGARQDTAFFPYDGYLGKDVDSIAYLRRFLEDQSSGVDLPAAIIVETVQGEGGIHVASVEWLRALEQTCRDFDVLLIVDDIQMGNGRTGTFFSFERAGIVPDMVTISKSFGGGLPLALLLMRPEIDQWQPGKHNGTFRGNNLGFVAATEALGFWDDDQLSREVQRKGELIKTRLDELVRRYPQAQMQGRGIGMVWGLEFARHSMASALAAEAFELGVLIETAGSRSQVLKFLPPLIIDDELLLSGLDRIEQALINTLARQ